MKKKIIISILCFAIAGLGLILFYNYMVRTRNVVEKLVLEKNMINILVAGSNKFNNNRHKFYSILSLNPENNNVGITFIPPSFRIFIDDDDKKNMPIGEVDFENDFDQIKKTLNRDLKLKVPFYIELYSGDVENIVDLIEGVDLFVLDKVSNISSLDFGLNYFDGKKIIKYINNVKENSIYLKYDRIQDILLTLYYNKEKKEIFNNLEFISQMLKSLRTNMLPQEIYKISQIVFNNGNLITITLPGNFENDLYIVDNIAYKIYEKNFLTGLIIDGDMEANTKIKILNGTSVSGLARKMRNELNRDGLNVVEFGTSKYPQMNHSIIINRKGNYAAVKKVSETTGIDNIYHIIDNTQLNNILIIIGKDLIR